MKGSADLAITGAAIYTVAPRRPWAEAIAIRDGRIAAVGSNEEVAPSVGPTTRVLHLSGQTVLPGFQDAHVHPDHGGLVLGRCNLHDLPGPQAYLAEVRAYAESHPEVAWILGGGWSLAHFPRGTPHRSLLDEVVPDRPVFLENRDGHGAWVNSRALEVAGINRDTADPSDGRIEREDTGEPFGVLHEGAMALARRHIPPPTRQDLEEALLEAQAHLHSLGVTAWQDAHVTEETLAAYRALEAGGRLTARVVGALWWDRNRGEEQIDELTALRGLTAGRFRATAVKIMQDGIPENFTAGMLEPYLEPEGRLGLSFVEPELLKRAVTRLDREGFQVHVHAIGDRACREALDAFEAAMEENGGSDHRHHIAHLQIVDPAEVSRFAQLGVVANAQPYWACMDDQMRDLCAPILGPDRVRRQYPFRSLVRSGARLALGSDWPVTTPDPLRIMQVAVTRVPYEAPDREPFLPHQRLDLPTAIAAATKGAAFVNHLDVETGSIEPGKLADLVVLDRNIFEVEPEEIGRASVIATLVEGRVVASSLEGLTPSES